MQTITDAFRTKSLAPVRKLDWRVAISFTKEFDATIDFFTIGVSAIGSDDIIAGENNVLQEWDQYIYTDYSNRIIRIEVNQEENQPVGSMVMGTADIVLDNHDDLFTPGADPVIGSYILPYRPVRISLGFDGLTIPMFIGLTEKLPDIDEKNKTATFHCMDFISKIYNKPLSQALVYTDVRTDELIDNLLQAHAGLTSSQYELDTGMNNIPVAFFEKGTKLGEILSELCEAEAGRLFMDEEGMIRFWNRQHQASAPFNQSQFTFTPNNIIELKVPKQDYIVNSVNVNSDVREVLGVQSVMKAQISTDPKEWLQVPAGSTLERFFELQDPVTDVELTTNILNCTFTANSAVDGTGTNLTSSISISSFSLFTKSIKVVFANSSGTDAYITAFEIFGTPAKVTKKIRVEVTDATSIAKYEERPLEITNNFIQTTSFANSLAQIVLNDRDDLGDLREIKIMGLPQLQVGDLVTVYDRNNSNDYYIYKISSNFGQDGFTQWLSLIRREIQSYFTIGISAIGGDDVIAP